MSLTATVAATISGTLTSALDQGTASFPVALANRLSYTDGTGASQCDILWSDTRTLAASATENLDLTGTLTNAFGATVANAKVKVVMVVADSGNTNDVVIGGAASNTFLGMFGDATDKINVKPGGTFLWAVPGTGATVTAGTGDILLVANSAGGTGVTYQIVIMGVSA